MLLGMVHNHVSFVTLVCTKIQQDLMIVLLVVQEKPQPHKGLQIPLSVSVYSTPQLPIIYIPVVHIFSRFPSRTGVFKCNKI